MSPTCTARNNVHRRKQENFGVHFYSESIQSVAQMEAHLGDLMHKLNWLGITEFYTASVCVYQHLSGLPYFPACVTSNSTSASARRQTMEPPSRPEYLRRLQSHDTHGVHLHPHMDVPPEVWKKVDALTKYDQRLYWMALRRFACGVGLFEQETGLSLDHLLIPGGWQWLFDLSDVMAAGWQHN